MLPQKPSASAVPYQGDLILGVRRIRTGSFSGLYEVVELSNQGTVVRIITDANTKALACSMASNAISRCL